MQKSAYTKVMQILLSEGERDSWMYAWIPICCDSTDLSAPTQQTKRAPTVSPCSLVDYAHKDKYTCVASTVGIILAVVSFIYFFNIYINTRVKIYRHIFLDVYIPFFLLVLKWIINDFMGCNRSTVYLVGYYLWWGLKQRLSEKCLKCHVPNHWSELMPAETSPVSLLQLPTHIWKHAYTGSK